MQTFASMVEANFILFIFFAFHLGQNEMKTTRWQKLFVHHVISWIRPLTLPYLTPPTRFI